MIRTSLEELRAALNKLDIPKNHVYVIHSSMIRFGLIEKGLPGVMGVLRDLLGPDATILMPAFTFSFGEKRVWDARTTKSEMGALTEYFRKLPETTRTLHPLHSFSVTGPRSAEFLACEDLSSFGPTSPFELLYQMNAVNIGLGTELEGGATFLHYGEEIVHVPYRYFKDFPGEVISEDGVLSDKTYKMFVREIGEDYEYDNYWEHVWQDFLDDGLATCEKIHGAKVFKFDIKPALDRFVERLEKNPFYCAEKLALKQIG